VPFLRVSALRDGAALIRRRGQNAPNLGDTTFNTISFNVPGHAERAWHRASALAPPRRATASFGAWGGPSGSAKRQQHLKK